MCRSLRPVAAAGAAVLAAVVAAVVATALAPGVCLGASAGDDAVRAVASRTYVHGITREVAERDLGVAAVPALLELLDDPSFARHDNVVAFLAHLGGRETTPRLLAFLSRTQETTPAEDRARLVAPQALGLIASRGDALALNALFELLDPESRSARTPEDIRHMARRGLAWSGSESARRRLASEASRDRSARQALALFDELHPRPAAPRGGRGTTASAPGASGTGTDSAATSTENGRAAAAPGHAGTPAPGAADPAATVVDHALTYANHVRLDDPYTDDDVDEMLYRASLALGAANFDADVACCTRFARGAPGRTFGTSGDGLDVIDSRSELDRVLASPVARVKVVRAINYCGGPGLNIIGCGYIGGFGLAVVRYGSSWLESGLLWLHEYGHNVGLQHLGDSQYLMYPYLSPYAYGLYPYECEAFHAPAAAALALTTVAGACTDSDGDQANDLTDNCPLDAEPSLADGDGDRAGNICDTCPYRSNPDQADADGDARGDACDNCPAVPNEQQDSDGDSVGDACDPCPADALNDGDGDGFCEAVDVCPIDADPGQEDADRDRFGDACDECPLDSINDTDGDGYCSNEDNCVQHFNPRFEARLAWPTARGASIAAAGDLNGDGYADVLLGDADDGVNGFRAGAAHLYAGSAAGLSERPVWTSRGAQGDDAFGKVVGGVGDVNRDGVPDVVIADGRGGAGLFHGNCGRTRGAARGRGRLPRPAVDRRCRGLGATPAWTAPPGLAGYGGFNAIGGGDLNGDGYRDVLLAAVSFGTSYSRGRVYAFLGSASGLSTQPDWTGQPPTGVDTESYGEAAVIAGDLDHDGYDDVAVAAPRASWPTSWKGRVYVYRGGPGGPAPSPIELVPAFAGIGFGSALAPAGDVNGDGYDDLLVGAPYFDATPGADNGAVYVYFGGPGGPTSDRHWVRHMQLRYGEYFGSVVAGPGDLDADGFDDVLVGASGSSRVYAFRGGAAGPGWRAAWTGAAANGGPGYGGSLGGAGDVDRDGRLEIIVATAGAGVYVYRGGPGGIDKSQPDRDADGTGDACDPTP